MDFLPLGFSAAVMNNKPKGTAGTIHKIKCILFNARKRKMKATKKGVHAAATKGNTVRPDFCNSRANSSDARKPKMTMRIAQTYQADISAIIIKATTISPLMLRVSRLFNFKVFFKLCHDFDVSFLFLSLDFDDVLDSDDDFDVFTFVPDNFVSLFSVSFFFEAGDFDFSPCYCLLLSPIFVLLRAPLFSQRFFLGHH